MQRRSATIPFVLLALIALAFTPTLTAQIQVDPIPITCTCPSNWPPKIKDIVNVDSNNGNPIVVPDGGISPASVYTVPLGKYLVVTNFEIVNSPSISVGGIALYPQAQGTPIQIVEEARNGTITVKRGLHFSGNGNGVAPGPFTASGSAGPQPSGAAGYLSSGVGLVFGPGASIKFQIRDLNSIDNTQSNAVVLVNYTLTGYLTNG